jgi:hypothetical protein
MKKSWILDIIQLKKTVLREFVWYLYHMCPGYIIYRCTRAYFIAGVLHSRSFTHLFLLVCVDPHWERKRLPRLGRRTMMRMERIVHHFHPSLSSMGSYFCCDATCLLCNNVLHIPKSDASVHPATTTGP